MNNSYLERQKEKQELEKRFLRAAQAMLATGATQCRIIDTPYNLVRKNGSDPPNLEESGFKLDIFPKWKCEEIESVEFLKYIKIRPDS